MKKLLALALVLIMCVSLLPIASSAAEDVYTDSRGNKVIIPGGADAYAVRVVSFTPGDPWTKEEKAMDPNAALGAPDFKGDNQGQDYNLGKHGSIVLEFAIFIVDGEGNDIYVFECGGMVEPTRVEVSSDLVTWYYVGDADGSLSGVDLSGPKSQAPADGKFKYVRITDLKGGSSRWPGADIDAVAGLNVKKPASGSQWANEELERADRLNLIPEILQDADLTADISRLEFAAVCVKVYENLANGASIPAVNNPFVDTRDIEVLKAYNIGAVNGTSATTFEPDNLLNREQAATMLTRVFKKVSLVGWTLATDSDFTLKYKMPAAFADDGDISGWARDSVYFMAAHGIVAGVGGNMFAPKNITTEQEALGYANATREQALLIALRMVENLGD